MALLDEKFFTIEEIEAGFLDTVGERAYISAGLVSYHPGAVMGFEEFKARSTPSSSKYPRVAIQTRGSISFNHASYVALGEPDYVVLLFDPEKRRIAIQPSDNSVRHAYPIRKQPSSRSYLVAGQAFCKYYEIDTSFTRAYEPIVKNNVLVLEEASGRTVATRNTRHSKVEQNKQEASEKEERQDTIFKEEDDDLPF